MTKQSNVRQNLNKFLVIVGYSFLSVLFVITLFLNVGAFLEPDPEERMQFAMGGAVTLMLFVTFFFLGRAMKGLDEIVANPEPKKKPLLCSCSKNNSRVYLFPQFIPYGRFACLGLLGAGIPALLATHNPDFLIIPSSIIVCMTFLFLGGVVDFMIRGHKLNCSFSRGITFSVYFIYASTIWRYYDVYVDRRSNTDEKRFLWLEIIEIVVCFLFLFPILFVILMLTNFLEYLFW